MAGNEIDFLDNEKILKRIYTIRCMSVMLDSDLAELYNVETKVFNQSVKRNIERFPKRFQFKLLQSEYDLLRKQFINFNKNTNLRTQNVTSSSSDHGGRNGLLFPGLTKHKQSSAPNGRCISQQGVKPLVPGKADRSGQSESLVLQQNSATRQG